MTNETEQLKGLFAAYFHEDWPDEEESPDHVVRTYVGDGRTAEQLLFLADAVDKYATRFASDGELERALFRELGCYYQPSSDGLSARKWLAHVANMLRDGATATE